MCEEIRNTELVTYDLQLGTLLGLISTVNAPGMGLRSLVVECLLYGQAKPTGDLHSWFDSAI